MFRTTKFLLSNSKNIKFYVQKKNEINDFGMDIVKNACYMAGNAVTLKASNTIFGKALHFTSNRFPEARNKLVDAYKLAYDDKIFIEHREEIQKKIKILENLTFKIDRLFEDFWVYNGISEDFEDMIKSKESKEN